MNSLESLRELIAHLPDRLHAIPSEKAAQKPKADAWSIKQELGHLLDSAANNHQRIVRAQLEESPAMAGYDGDAWVALHRYQERDWEWIITGWSALNQQLLAAAEAVPPAAWTRTLTIADSGSLTLQYVFDDYVDHMLEHLRHMGVEVGDLAPAKAAVH